jgi:hypothetical protein
VEHTIKTDRLGISQYNAKKITVVIFLIHKSECYFLITAHGLGRQKSSCLQELLTVHGDNILGHTVPN